MSAVLVFFAAGAVVSAAAAAAGRLGEEALFSTDNYSSYGDDNGRRRRREGECSSVPLGARADCGYNDISVELCEQRGCCYDDKKQGDVVLSASLPHQPRCYYASPAGPVRRVHVVFANHFDAGYTALAGTTLLEGKSSTVINLYFHDFFPVAARVGAAVRNATGSPLGWMTQSWLVSLFLWCPPSLGGIECPSAAEVVAFKEAVKEGDITWHAFPHNAQLSLASATLVEELVGQSHALDNYFSLPRKTVLSQRDVVGMPRSIVGALAKVGVTGISVGSNGRCLPPNVPNAFRWRDNNREAVVLWHPYGYGSSDDEHSLPYTRLPNDSSDVLYYAWNGDNLGPPTSLEEVLQTLDAVKRRFPNADVFPSTLEALYLTIKKENLPVVTSDLEDTWIQGASQVPDLMRQHRALQRALGTCLESKDCLSETEVNKTKMGAVRNFTRLLSKNVEHTKGASLPKYGGSLKQQDYSNAAFHADRGAGDATYAFFERSWRENADFGVEAALEALDGDDEEGIRLRRHVDAELLKLSEQQERTNIGDLRSWKRVSITEDVSITLGGFDLVVDAKNGCLRRCSSSGEDWASPSNPLALLLYQTLSDDDLSAFREEYLWGGNEAEFGRPNATELNGARTALVKPTLLGLYYKTNMMMIELGFPSLYHEEYGAPERAWLCVEAVDETLRFDLRLENKTATRYLEAIYLLMHPSGGGDWALEQMGAQWISPHEAEQGTSKTIRAVGSGVAFRRNNNETLTFESPDTPLVNFNNGNGDESTRGEPRPYPMPLRPLDTTRGLSFQLLANGFWNTNYPTFLPYTALYKDFFFHFDLHFPR